MKLEVSAVVPTYNRADMLGETLGSIVDQTLPPVEVIVVDDGSTDDTEAVVRRFGSTVRYHRIANGGVTRARNYGASVARAPWIAFCDSDDLWREDHLASHLRLLSSAPELPFLFSDFHLVLDSVWEAKAKFSTAPSGYWAGGIQFDAGIVFEAPLYQRVLRFQPIFQSTILMRHTYFQEVGGYDSAFARTLSEDLDFVLRCVQAGPVGVVTRATVGIRKHPGNYSGNLLETLLGELTILRHAQARHPAGAVHGAVIADELIKRSWSAAELAFSAGRLDVFRQVLGEVPRERWSTKLRLKALVSGLPDRIASPLRNALCLAGSAAGPWRKG